MENALSDKKRIVLAEEVIEYIRKRLSRKMNYLAPAIHFLTLLPVEEEDRMATDGHYLFYHPDYILKTYKASPQKLQMEYMHIVGHCILEHIAKRKGTQQKIYDCAADCAVTAFINNMNVNGLKERNSIDKQGQGKMVMDLVKQKGITGVYDFLCNNPRICVEIVQKGEELYKDNHTYWNQLHPAVAKAQAENINSLRLQGKSINQWMNEYQKKILEGWMQLKNLSEAFRKYDDKSPVWGSQGGYGNGNFTMSGENDISYKDFLNRFLSIHEKNRIDLGSFDYTWYTIGLREYGNIPILEPLEYCEDRVADDLIIALDTSGSCTDSMNRFLRETYNILSDMDLRAGVNLRIIQCDTQISEDKVIHTWEDVPDFSKGYRIKGFGGTDFRPVFRYVDELLNKGEIKRVKGLLYFSDGLGDFPVEPTDYETVFILPPGEYTHQEIPKWITKVILTDKDLCYNDA